jgi:hypothetical protein
MTLALKKILGLVLAWKSGLKVKVPFLPVGRTHMPSANILLSDLVDRQPNQPINLQIHLGRHKFIELLSMLKLIGGTDQPENASSEAHVTASCS